MNSNHRINYVPIKKVIPYSGNARTHSPAQVKQIQKSIEAFGFINPVLMNRDGQLVAGHGRLLAAKELGLSHIPAIQIDHLSEDQLRAYMLADNQIAENAGWDPDLLKVELAYLTQVDIDFDVELTGFSAPEIDIVLGAAEQPPEEPPLPPLPTKKSLVIQAGDLWHLGPHRLFCGDCREPQALERLMGGERARMVFTDPPYNVPLDGHARGKGNVRHDDFVMAAGELSPEAFTEFLKTGLGQLARGSRDGALAFVCMDWRHMGELLAAGEEVFTELINLCVWNKSSGGMGSLYRSKHELVFVFKKGRRPHINNIQLGRYGRNRTNVWDYPGVNSFGAGREEALEAHPTVKPVQMIADALLDGSKRGEIVLDGFAGSGSTLLAAERTGRIFRGIEIDPRYVEVTLCRWREATGEEPIHDHSWRTYRALEKQRAGRETA